MLPQYKKRCVAIEYKKLKGNFFCYSKGCHIQVHWIDFHFCLSLILKQGDIHKYWE